MTVHISRLCPLPLRSEPKRSLPILHAFFFLNRNFLSTKYHHPRIFCPRLASVNPLFLRPPLLEMFGYVFSSPPLSQGPPKPLRSRSRRRRIDADLISTQVQKRVILLFFAPRFFTDFPSPELSSTHFHHPRFCPFPDPPTLASRKVALTDSLTTKY